MMPEPTTVATRSKVPKNSAVNRLRRFGFTGLTDPINFLLNCELVQASKGEAQKERDSPFENHECVSKGAFYLFWCTRHCGRVGNAPVRCHWLTRPERASFLRSEERRVGNEWSA